MMENESVLYLDLPAADESIMISSLGNFSKS